MGKFSPRPWYRKGLSVYGADGKSVASTGNSRARSFEQSQDDADLIAAAPDLYEAARAALDRVPPGPVKDALVDALLKAEGGSHG